MAAHAVIPKYTIPGKNRRVVLGRRPDGVPLATDFDIVSDAVPVISDGQFLVRNLYLSADPVQRGWAANPAVMALGAPMRALSVGVVQESREATIKPGDLVYGFLGWQDFAAATRDDLLSHVPIPRAAASSYAGVLGMPGVTAWLALADLAPPGPDDTVLVSTSAGAVGSVVGQIARAQGSRVIGLTGSDEKVARCTSRYGYHAAFNYKSIDLPTVLAAAAPTGFSIYFDNTGGWIADHAIRAMAKHGRIIQCGTAATANWSPPPAGWRPEREILTRVLTWSGFYIFDHVARFGAAIDALSDLIDDGALAYDEDIEPGFDQITGALETLFAGTNSGKKLIFIGDA
ncbi:NADP-dependent oxidoreductase [Sphingomonas aliaeris]|uniref:NADP-dependent oxidoreductase n=1 Tax=Sphingomonas aliaeris TaxID=2759526 RepID=A0A974NV86_9SPHN|nr:NADP-dependent oxidoreductase [Sphingomonas aliaeris]QQV77669.1 NADP-dependent oxidoreductase [Sphingomonas aliaeris]